MKILVCTDGRDFQVVACPYTEEQKAGLAEVEGQ